MLESGKEIVKDTSETWFVLGQAKKNSIGLVNILISLSHFLAFFELRTYIYIDY